MENSMPTITIAYKKSYDKSIISQQPRSVNNHIRLTVQSSFNSKLGRQIGTKEYNSYVYTAYIFIRNKYRCMV